MTSLSPAPPDTSAALLSRRSCERNVPRTRSWPPAGEHHRLADLADRGVQVGRRLRRSAPLRRPSQDAERSCWFPAARSASDEQHGKRSRPPRGRREPFAYTSIANAGRAGCNWRPSTWHGKALADRAAVHPAAQQLVPGELHRAARRLPRAWCRAGQRRRRPGQRGHPGRLRRGGGRGPAQRRRGGQVYELGGDEPFTLGELARRSPRPPAVRCSTRTCPRSQYRGPGGRRTAGGLAAIWPTVILGLPGVSCWSPRGI